MSLFKFEESDVLVNRIKTYPESNFLIWGGKTYYNNRRADSGSFVNNAGGVPVGHINLYELNVDRSTSSLIYPFVTKGSTRTNLSTITTKEFNSDFVYGDTISGSYPLSASISVSQSFAGNCGGSTQRPRIDALRNVLNQYKINSNHYSFSSSLGDKNIQHLTLVSVPSIFFGSSIQKGSVQLTFNISGSKTGELRDLYKNGELIETTGSNTGSVAGVVLYKEGFVVLTGSWNLVDSHTETYDYCNDTSDNPKWSYWGSTLNGTTPAQLTPSSSYELKFKGVNYIPTITMYAHAKEGMLNHSNNPTFAKFDQNNSTNYINSTNYVENPNLEIKNIVKTDYNDPTGSFEKIVYISSVGVYDKEKNLIAIAKLAKPVKKTEKRALTFKLRLDI